MTIDDNSTRTLPPTVRCHVLDTGYCVALESLVIRGGAWRRVALHSLVAVIEHPIHGWLLWDTGYAPRMFDATVQWPYSLYRRATPLYIHRDLAVINQLARLGLVVGDIRRVLLSHFHADHLAGLRDFPTAEVIAHRSAFEDVAARHGMSALRRAFLPALLPDDFASRATLIADFTGPTIPQLGPTHDIFGDSSLLLVQLPGHARGQQGLLANTDRGQVLFAADSCWLTRSIRERLPPSRLTSVITDSPNSLHTTIWRLHAFAAEHPDVRIVPSHCPEAFEREVKHGLGGSRYPA
jgi:glyoxylase-like metal-dependent hydrolase (beta-lactamase superfamily II)